MKKKIWNCRDGNVSIDSTDKRFRSPNITPCEKDLLLSLVRKRLTIVDCKKTDIASQNMKAQEWHSICDEFNAISGLFQRTPVTLRAAWDNWKKVVRKHWLLDKSGATMKKDPFIGKVASVMLETQELLNNLNCSAENAENAENSPKDTVFREVSEKEMMEIVKTDMLLSDDTFQNSNESHQSDSASTSADLSPTDITGEPSLKVMDRQTFSNLMSLSACSSSQPISCSSTVDSAQPSSADKDLAECMSLGIHEDRLTEDVRYAHESHDLQIAKIEAIKVMTKNSVEEHKMLQELFAIKMLQEKEKLELDRRKYDVENERLSQEKIRSQILLLQLEKIRKEVN